MKSTLLAMVLLYSCSMSREPQVEMRSGKITKVQLLSRYNNSHLKRIEWTLDDGTKRYQYLSADHETSLGRTGIFLVGR